MSPLCSLPDSNRVAQKSSRRLDWPASNYNHKKPRAILETVGHDRALATSSGEV
jgi:hypothetical protein